MKLIKLLGALMIVFGLFFGISASAELAGTPLTDDFNRFTADEPRNQGREGYPKNADESEVFKYDSTYSKNYGASSIKTGAGPDGSTALAVGGLGTDISLMTKGMNTTGNTVYELSYDVKFSRKNTMDICGNSMWNASKPLFKFTSDGNIEASDDGSTYETAGTYDANTWYNVTIILDGTNKYGWISDGTNNVYSTVTETTSSAKQISVIHMGYAAAGSTLVTIDNVKIASYDTTANKPSCVVSSVEDTADEVQRNVSLNFEFDQAILPSVAIGSQAAGAVTLQETESSNPVTVTCTKTAYNKITVAYTGLLAKDTNYTVAFTGVTNGDLACTDTIAFTTEEMHVWNDVTISTVAANTDDATKTDITLTIADEYGYPTFEGMAMAVVYVPYPDTELYTMTKADMVSANGATGARTLTFALGTIPSNAKICVILLDTTYGPIPVASGMYE